MCFLPWGALMSHEFDSISCRLAAIETRNARVEADKAWETSWTRRILIAAITYVTASVLLFALGAAEPWLGSLVPVAGYLLSTLTVPVAREMWMKGKGNHG